MEQSVSVSKVRKILYLILYFGFLICMSLILCEGAVRAYSWLFFPKMLKFDSSYGWTHTVNTQRYYESRDSKEEKGLTIHNNLGHRGPNYSEQPSPGKKRVLILGDSFAEGAPVGEDQLFSNIILNTYTNLEVMNSGVRGWGSVQEYLYLLKTGINLNPDLVLLLFCENDPSDSALSYHPHLGYRPYATIQNGELVIHEELSAEGWRKYNLPLPYADKLEQHSLAYSFFNSRLYQPLKRSYIDQVFKEEEGKIDVNLKLEIVKMIYQKMNVRLKDKGIQFVIGLVPSREEAQNGVSEMHTLMLSFCKANCIPCISLVQSLKESYDKGKIPYYINDPHWNKDGHQAVSNVLGPFIQEHIKGT